jgi:hypothetical protein
MDIQSLSPEAREEIQAITLTAAEYRNRLESKQQSISDKLSAKLAEKERLETEVRELEVSRERVQAVIQEVSSVVEVNQG